MRQWWIGRTAGGFDKWLTAKHPDEQECINCFISSDESEECVEYIPVQEILPDTVTITRQEFREAMEYGINYAMSKKNMIITAANYLFGERND